MMTQALIFRGDRHVLAKQPEQQPYHTIGDGAFRTVKFVCVRYGSAHGRCFCFVCGARQACDERLKHTQKHETFIHAM